MATTWLPYDKVAYLKVLEDVFERTYNSGKFTYLFAWLGRHYAPDYMKLYEALTDEWLVLHNDQKALSDESLCHFLWHCLTDILDLTGAQQALAKELLALDMLTFFRFRLHPDFLGWCEAPRSRTDAIFRDEAWLQQYVPDYHFTNWRDIKMRYRIWPVSPALKVELRRYGPVPDGEAYLLAEKKKDRASWRVIPVKGE